MQYDPEFEALFAHESAQAKEMVRVAHYRRAPTIAYDSLTATDVARLLAKVAEYEDSKQNPSPGEHYGGKNVGPQS